MDYQWLGDTDRVAYLDQIVVVVDIEIHSSRVACLDRLVVEVEVVDNEIHSSGVACLDLVVVDIDTQRHRVPCLVLVDIVHMVTCVVVVVVKLEMEVEVEVVKLKLEVVVVVVVVKSSC
ncbi:Hypothetical predicted protein [Olea europaea subsp. europaea]|uniref:Uncharacterized protein n=1 Tax=Olea europaea subsp. europaea TaxID=158383 RepID=A0A8S0RIW5_OLEEU|nr:Hypothetical predicted protein [Olea europaea subsp. europaea]